MREMSSGESDPEGRPMRAIARPYLKNVAMIAETSAETGCGG